MNKKIIQLAKFLFLVEPRAKAREVKLKKRLSVLERTEISHPLVSVLVPAYNVEKYLEHCLRSICEQTYERLEIICVNDASSDDTLAILRRWHNKDKRIKIIDKKRNEGLPQARKSAFEASNGEFILNVDSDDWLETSMISDLLLLALSEKADLVYCDYFRNEKAQRVQRQYYESKMKLLEHWSFGFGNTIWNRLIKRELMEKIDFPHANMGEDLVLNTQLYYYANKIFYCGKALYHHTYLENKESISSANSQKNFSEMLENYLLVHDFCLEKFGENSKIEARYQERIDYIQERIRKVKNES